jgi:hypothetical protein
MPDELRAKVIRLAHARPELRPHLLPLLKSASRQKEAWSRIPDDHFDFGYEGAGAEAVGLDMAIAVQGVVQQMKEQSSAAWKSLASKLLNNRRVDAQPSLSRRVVALALMDTHADLTKKVEAYFKALP